MESLLFHLTLCHYLQFYIYNSIIGPVPFEEFVGQVLQAKLLSRVGFQRILTGAVWIWDELKSLEDSKKFLTIWSWANKGQQHISISISPYTDAAASHLNAENTHLKQMYVGRSLLTTWRAACHKKVHVYPLKTQKCTCGG